MSIAAHEVLTPRRIVFGVGASARLGEQVAALLVGTMRRRASILLVTGRDPSRHRASIEALATEHDLVTISAPQEPTVEEAQAGVRIAREAGAVAVVAIGGGSAIDLGKAIAALAPNEGEPLDYLEVVGRGQPLRAQPLPFVAVPTTAGTGAEATKNAVLSAEAGGVRVKVSLRSNAMLPALAIIDPALTLSVPADVTAATGLDALTQVIEPFLSNAATPFTDALCREAIPRGACALPRVFAHGDALDARTEMSLVSLYGGLALANAKLGAVHGFAGPLGGLLGAPHGAICARLLPLVLETNLLALRARAPGSPTIARMGELACWLLGDPGAQAEDAARWAAELVASLGIPSLGTFGLEASDLARVAADAARSSSMKGNPITLEPAELVKILERARG